MVLIKTNWKIKNILSLFLKIQKLFLEIQLTCERDLLSPREDLLDISIMIPKWIHTLEI